MRLPKRPFTRPLPSIELTTLCTPSICFNGFQEFLDEGVQGAMLELLDDTCASVRVKALLCFSALVRQFVPGAHAARELGLVPRLCSLPSADGYDVRVHRCATVMAIIIS